MLVMSLAVGYIFSGFLGRFNKPAGDYDPLKQYKKSFGSSNLKFAILVTAPAIILHELGHKFLAISFGMEATFNAAYFWLGLGVLLKLMNFNFIFFVPAYVSIMGTGTPLQYGLIAFAGPAVNLILWLGTLFIYKNRLINKKYNSLLLLTSKINMFLFIFNILPLPGFDGSKVFSGLLQAVF